ncbi:hypothetical protein ACM66B_000274 [Microbotryomycetes sp. NB124-2]
MLSQSASHEARSRSLTATTSSHTLPYTRSNQWTPFNSPFKALLQSSKLATLQIKPSCLDVRAQDQLSVTSGPRFASETSLSTTSESCSINSSPYSLTPATDDDSTANSRDRCSSTELTSINALIRLAQTRPAAHSSSLNTRETTNAATSHDAQPRFPLSASERAYYIPVPYFDQAIEDHCKNYKDAFAPPSPSIRAMHDEWTVPRFSDSLLAFISRSKVPEGRHSISGLNGESDELEPDSQDQLQLPSRSRQPVLASNLPTYTCNLCPKTFSRSSALKVHKRSHSKEQPYACYVQGCQKSFSVSSNLNRHLKVSTTNE